MQWAAVVGIDDDEGNEWRARRDGEEGEGRGRLGGVVTLLTVVEWNVAGPAMNGGGCLRVTSLPLLTAADSVTYESRPPRLIQTITALLDNQSAI